MKPLSEQLAELSVRAKGAEDAFAAAENEARDKIEVRKAEAAAAAKSAVDKVGKQFKSARDSASQDWNTLQAKIASDMNDFVAHVAQVKRGLDAQRAENRAEILEEDASFAIDYAIAAVEQAKLAVLDAADARRFAAQAGRA
jgi:hypothetical protein